MAASQRTKIVTEIVIAGGAASGKSRLIAKICSDRKLLKPLTEYDPTIGVDFAVNDETQVGGTKWQIWDTAGQENYHSITISCFRDAKVVLLTLNQNGDYDKQKTALEIYKQHIPKSCHCILVVTKTDLLQKISDEQIKSIQEQLGVDPADVIRCSVTDDSTIDRLKGRIRAAIPKLSSANSTRESKTTPDSSNNSSYVVWLKILSGIASVIAGALLLALQASTIYLTVGGCALVAVGIGLFAHGIKQKNQLAEQRHSYNP